MERAAIEQRLDAVTVLVRDPVGRAALREALDGVRDIERLASKAAAGRATPRELRALGDSLARLPRVAHAARGVRDHVSPGAAHGGVLGALLAEWDDGADCAERLTRMLVERPPLADRRGGHDRARHGRRAGRAARAARRRQGRDRDDPGEERARTGIASLKVGFNRVFGYYLEISNANKHLVPDDYQRRQTLTGAERYVTPALKEYEEKVLTAAERIEIARARAVRGAAPRGGRRRSRGWQAVARRVAHDRRAGGVRRRGGARAVRASRAARRLRPGDRRPVGIRWWSA